MDPLTQAIFCACLPAFFARGYEIRLIAFCGFIAGLLPFAENLIFLIFGSPAWDMANQRQFFYSITFVPLGALITSLIVMGVRRFLESRGVIEFKEHRTPQPGAGRMLVSRQFEILKDTPMPPVGPPLTFPRLYRFSLFGFLGPGFLSACSIGGCIWLWPFLETRTSWHLLGRIDLFFSGLLFAGLLAGMLVRDKKPVRWGLLAAMLYLGVALVHRERAEGSLRNYAVETLEREPIRVIAIPTANNLLVYRGAIQVGAGRIDLVGVRIPPLGQSRIYPGESAEALVMQKDFPRLDSRSPLSRDLEALLNFAEGWVGIGSESDSAPYVFDLRYNHLPHTVEPRKIFMYREGTGEAMNLENAAPTTEQRNLTYFRMLINQDIDG